MSFVFFTFFCKKKRHKVLCGVRSCKQIFIYLDRESVMNELNQEKVKMDREKRKKRKDLIRYINMKLASMNMPIYSKNVVADNGKNMSDDDFMKLTENLLANYREKIRLLSGHIINPVDMRIQSFINDYLKDIEYNRSIRIPDDSLVIDEAGMARELSLPPDKDEYLSPQINSYRIRQGILHNPKHDRRTTKGTFHIVTGGLPIPPDKKAVPKIVFANLLHEALNPPKELLELPFTANQEKKANLFVSLLLRPVVSPEVRGVKKEKSLEIRFFVPAALVGNLDFVESIFGNGGNPYLFKNDAALDVEHWTGHTGCVILAPHLIKLKKKDIGLPHWEDASERRRRDGMCWRDEDELYNDGKPFKLTCRDASGVAVTIIADNYFGYSKKEIKAMISYSANLFGGVEEEHSGGTLAFLRKNCGRKVEVRTFYSWYHDPYTFEDVKLKYQNIIDFKPENYGVDKKYSNIIYIPENALLKIEDSSVSWMYNGKIEKLKLMPDYFYVAPSGQKFQMEKHPFAPEWRIVLTNCEGHLLHKPSTVSGGGKSEISKSLLNAINYGSFFIDDIDKDFEIAGKVISFDFSKRWKNKDMNSKKSRPLLSPERSLGSVIKLLTPNERHTEVYRKFIEAIPKHIKALIIRIKQMTRLFPNLSWDEFFSVDFINGRKGHSLLSDDRKVISSYLRVGFTKENAWYMHSLRPDFIAAAKVQIEDDISASTVLPVDKIEGLNPNYPGKSAKFVQNCEKLFFQRPDEAIHRGYDKEAEKDLSDSKLNTFISNYEPLTAEDGKELLEDAILFDQYTDPVKELIKIGATDDEFRYFISPSHPRVLADGKRSGNPRYLQRNPAFSKPLDKYLAEVGEKLYRKLDGDAPVLFPVNDVLPGRKNNPPNKKAGIKPLCVYNPIHYQEYPELLMDFVCSLTGKSPSTTGAGSEGALTKGPFNMLVSTTDLNNALLSYILTGYSGYSTPAGYVGPNYRIDHDISILIPELWCRMMRDDKNPEELIKTNALEKLEDFEYEGKKVCASRLGYRITENFVFRFFGKVFEEPAQVFTPEMLKPELQSMEDFVDGVNNIVDAQKKVALMYFEDGSVEAAIPPLKVLLYVMAYGDYKGKDISDPELRQMFTRDYVVNSDWYRERLQLKQKHDVDLWRGHVKYLENFISDSINISIVKELNLYDRLNVAKDTLEKVSSKEYFDDLNGTIGLDKIFVKKTRS